MSTDENSERPLPVSFWSPPQLSADQLASLIPEIQVAPPEIEQWRASFELLGTTVEDAKQRFDGLFSELHGRTMHTYEDFYRHIQFLREYAAKQAAKDEAATEPESAPAVSQRTLESRAKKQRIEEARKAWKDAIVLQNKAMADWREYVNKLHDAYNVAKLS